MTLKYVKWRYHELQRSEKYYKHFDYLYVEKNNPYFQKCDWGKTQRVHSVFLHNCSSW